MRKPQVTLQRTESRHAHLGHERARVQRIRAGPNRRTGADEHDWLFQPPLLPAL